MWSFIIIIILNFFFYFSGSPDRRRPPSWKNNTQSIIKTRFTSGVHIIMVLHVCRLLLLSRAHGKLSKLNSSGPSDRCPRAYVYIRNTSILLERILCFSPEENVTLIIIITTMTTTTNITKYSTYVINKTLINGRGKFRFRQKLFISRFFFFFY